MIKKALEKHEMMLLYGGSMIFLVLSIYIDVLKLQTGIAVNNCICIILKLLGLCIGIVLICKVFGKDGSRRTIN